MVKRTLPPMLRAARSARCIPSSGRCARNILMRLISVLPLLALLLMGFMPQAAPSNQDAPPDTIKPLPRIRPACPIRLGGVFTLGLGGKSAPLEESAALGTPLSKGNADWIPNHCDVIALN